MKRANGGQFARIPYDMLKHVAFRTLSGLDVRTLLEMWTRFNGRNNGEIWLSVRDGAETLGVDKDGIAASLACLQSRGFIVKTNRGSRMKHVSPRWRLTMLPCGDIPPTNDWRCWNPGDDFSPSPESDADQAFAEAAA